MLAPTAPGLERFREQPADDVAARAALSFGDGVHLGHGFGVEPDGVLLSGHAGERSTLVDDGIQRDTVEDMSEKARCPECGRLVSVKVDGGLMHHLRPEERFWAKVNRTDDCWTWTANIDRSGYGRFWVGPSQSGILAHRISWELANGPIPGDLQVLHRCDNRPCVRPDHLFLGTNQDNIDDKMAKGRWRNRVSKAPAGVVS